MQRPYPNYTIIGTTAVGAMTSGGTESILIAMKAYRDWARAVKGITNPNIVAVRTAHPALDKACEYFNINLRKVHENVKVLLTPFLIYCRN